MKLLVSDFDHTLFTEDYLINIKKINEFVDNGNMFVIATGRNLTYLKKDISGFNIKYSYLICNDGAVIFDKDEKVIYRNDIDQYFVKPLFSILENDPNIEQVFIDTTISYTKDLSNSANAVIAKPYDLIKARELLITILKLFPSIHGYISARWINLTNKKANKGLAVQYLGNLLNISNDDIYTIGDNVNDIPMCEMFNGYAMETAHQDLIKVSKGTKKAVFELIDSISR
ncbi:MAG: HAD-IIB family hydrolase [Mollicutes bacterium]|nr:HAD-IIB family hydrolase [Mollicutes bacterium]